MPKRILLAGAAATALLAGCQSTKPTATTKQSVVETLGTVPVPASEFAYVYRKNNGTAPDFGTRASVDEYLNLYTNFKLKVLDAERRGLDTTQAFRRELDGYKQQLAQPYLTEKSVTDQLVREAYDRLSQEINASHILIRLAPDASPKDTLAAYQKAQTLRQRVTTGGQDFTTVAREASEDPSAKENGGRLGYFTSMQMVYPFESAAYKTPVGQVSEPVRTRFGYHLIKVYDARPAQGEIKVAHLMVRATPNMPAADSVTAKKKIDELYSRLQRGENWNKLVAQFSEDAGSAPNGGEIPAFGAGRMIPSFEEVAFRLQKSGELSKPVQTPYGWHIIKLIEKVSVPSFETMQPTLKSKVAKDSRSELNHAAFLKRIRTEDKFEENTAGKEFVLAKADTALLSARFKYAAPATAPKSKGRGKNTTNPTLFTISGKPYSATDFLAYAEQNQRARADDEPRHAMQVLYDQYVGQSLTAYERDNLEGKYEDYRMLVKEYRDGILLFQLMDEKVWSKALEDSVGLQTFFTQHQPDYQWTPRVQATVVSAASPALLTQAKSIIALGRYQVRDVPAPVVFKAGSAELNSGATAALQQVADRLNADTTITVSVNGQFKRGERAALARQRAERVVTYLTAQGIDASRLKAVATAKATAAGNTTFTLTTTNPTAVEATLNRQNPLAVQIAQRTYAPGENKAVDQVWQRGPGTYEVQQDGRSVSVTIDKQLPAGPKKLAEARGQATSDYQNYLEKEWVDQLRATYPVQLNQAEVNKLVTK